jgi:predicted lipid-binding transport protein (Tim44 family)
VVAVVAIRFMLRRFGPAGARTEPTLAAQGAQYAGPTGELGSALRPQAGGFGSGPQPQADGAGFDAGRYGAGAADPGFAPNALPAASALPAGFDAAAFERIAKLIFIRMQAANDKSDLEDLRQFATPEMFAEFRLELQERKGASQQTDVVQLDAQVLDFAQEAARQVVSVRFHGLIREEKDGPAAPFDEVWHLVKPADGSREWAIAGIAQYS